MPGIAWQLGYTGWRDLQAKAIVARENRKLLSLCCNTGTLSSIMVHHYLWLPGVAGLAGEWGNRQKTVESWEAIKAPGEWGNHSVTYKKLLRK